MLQFLRQYWGTILVAAVLLAIVVLIVVKRIQGHKKGKTSCGCGCEHCASSGMCHKKETGSAEEPYEFIKYKK